MPIGVKPTVDFAFKKIFGSPENAVSLIALLNAILDLPEPITDVEIKNPFKPQEFAGDKLVVLDVKAKDTSGRFLNIEMQVTVHPGLLSRLVYYACSMYVEQLRRGNEYAALRPAISICLLSQNLFPQGEAPHHRFQLIDKLSGRRLEEGIEVHTVELLKYTMQQESIVESDPIEQWAFFLLFADQFDAISLRRLLPKIEFQQAITVIEAIAAKEEDRTMYDQRMKAQLDYKWVMESVRREGLEEGRQAGLQEGLQEGRQEGMMIGAVQTLQRLLGDDVSAADEIAKLSKDELDALLDELQERLRPRNG